MEAAAKSLYKNTEGNARVFTKKEHEKIVRSGKKFLADKGRYYKKIYEDIVREAAVYPLAALNYRHPAQWYKLQADEYTSMSTMPSLAFYYGEFDGSVPQHGDAIVVVDGLGDTIMSFEFNRYRAMAAFLDWFVERAAIPDTYREEYKRMRDRMHERAAGFTKEKT